METKLLQRKAGTGIAKLYLSAVLLFLPFYKQNNYFDMTYAKAKFLWITGGTLLFVYIVITLKNICSGMKRKSLLFERKSISVFLQKLSGLDISVLLFVLSVWCSFLTSRHRMAAFWGNAGWFMGCFTITILAGMYFIIRKHKISARFVIRLAAAPVGILGVWGIFHSFHVDIGGLHEGISNDFYDYIMTIGNVNWYVGILSMIFPMICILYFAVEQKVLRIMIVFYADVIYYNLIICRSNGIFLGLLGGGIVICAYILNDKGAIRKLWKLLLHFCVISGIVWGICHFYHGKYVEMDSIFYFIIEKKIWLYAGAAIGILLVLSEVFEGYKKKHEKEKFVPLYSKISAGIERYRWWLFWIFVLAGLGTIVIYEACCFSDSWGTKRGALWIYAIKIWQKFKWKYKIFGCGCDCFGIVFMDTYGGYVNQVYLNAHNEFLQYLVTTGIFGLMSYSSIWIFAIWKFIKQRQHNLSTWVLFSGVLGYLGQAVVNNPQAFNDAVLFIILALLSAA